MENETNELNRLNATDLQILLDLHSRRVPLAQRILSNGAEIDVVLGDDKSIFLEDIVIDVDQYRRNCIKQESHFRFSSTIDSKSRDTRTSWAYEHPEIGLEKNENGVKMIYTDFQGFSYGLKDEEILLAAKNLALPATLKNKIKIILRGFNRETVVNGITCKTPSREYLELEGKIIPRYVSLVDITPQAEENWRMQNVALRVEPLQKSADHMSKIPKKMIYPNLPTLLKEINHEPKIGTHTSAYDSCGERFIDKDGMVNLGIQHYNASSWDVHHQTYPDQYASVGYVKFRPVLSTGEIATSDIITKYLSNLDMETK